MPSIPRSGCIRIGRGVYIGPFCNLGLCTVEDDVLLATEVHVMSGFAQHGYESLDTPIREQKGRLLNIRIGADTWVGNKSVGVRTGAYPSR